jgi:hypothetical protein
MSAPAAMIEGPKTGAKLPKEREIGSKVSAGFAM